MGEKRSLLAFILLTTILGAAVGPRTDWKITRNMSLEWIAKNVYGHRAYWHLIAIFNTLPMKDESPILRVGTIVRTPPLPLLLETAGLFPRYMKPFTVIFSVVSNYRRLQVEVNRIKNQSANRGKINFPLPSSLAMQCRQMGVELKNSAAEIARLAEGQGHIPQHTLRQLQEAAAYLHNFAEGNFKYMSKDMDMVEQRVAHALANAVAWAAEMAEEKPIESDIKSRE